MTAHLRVCQLCGGLLEVLLGLRQPEGQELQEAVRQQQLKHKCCIQLKVDVLTCLTATSSPGWKRRVM